MKNFLIAGLLLITGCAAPFAQQSQKNEILSVARRTNDYFMAKYADPNEIYHANGKSYETNLWTRSVYYEDLWHSTRWTRNKDTPTT